MTPMSAPKTAFLLQRPAVRALALLLSVVATVLVAWLWQDGLRAVDQRVLDRAWALGERQQMERRIVIVDVDERSVEALGAWPWPRDLTARLLQRVAEGGAALRLVDMVFDAARAHDPLLKAALQAGPPTVVGQVFALDPHMASVRVGQTLGALQGVSCPPGAPQAHGHLAPHAAIVSPDLGVGHVTPTLDRDGVVRRVPTVVCNEQGVYPSLVVAGLSALTGQAPSLQPSAEAAAHAVQVGEFTLPTDEAWQMMVAYRQARAGFRAISAVDLLQDDAVLSQLRGALVIVGSTALGASDAISTPQASSAAGVEIHAQMLAAALDARVPHEPLWSKAWLLAFALMLVLLMALGLRHRGRGVNLVVPLVSLVGLLAAVAIPLWALAAADLWLPVTPALSFALFLGAFTLVGESASIRLERERVYANLASYLPADVARRVALSPPSETVVAERHDATVMFVDLRNFSAYCEGHSPEEAATVLHIFYSTIDHIVAATGGVVEQVVGDSVMAVWNGSRPCTEHAPQAMAAAQRIWREGVAQLPTHGSREVPPLDLGVGIETGSVVVGSFGPAMRRVHSVLGESVTVARRLESMTGDLAHPILVGPNCVRRVGAQGLSRLGSFLLEGLSAPRVVHAIPVEFGAKHLDLVYRAEGETGASKVRAVS